MAKENFKEDSLRNYNFQNWLAEKRVMRRRPVREVDLGLTHKEIRGEHLSEKMLSVLYRRSGYLLSTDDIGLRIYGNEDNRNRERVNALGFELKNRKLSDPTVIFHAKELGWAVGVSDLAVTANSYLILYRLWLNLPNWVDEKDIAQSVYGTIHESDINAVRQQTLKLRHGELPKTQARIEADQLKNPSKHAYRLIGNEKEYTREELTPSYLGLEFQNWLAHPEIGLIKRKHKRIYQKKSEEIYRKDIQLLTVLREYNGFLVPYNVLSYILYNSEDEVVKLRETFSNLKDRGYITPEDVYVFPDLGLGYGIKDVLLTHNQMKLMHMLWQEKNDGAPIPRIILARDIYGIASEPSEKKIESLLSKTRKVLSDANSDCAIETVKDNNRLAYQLASRRNR